MSLFFDMTFLGTSGYNSGFGLGFGFGFDFGYGYDYGSSSQQSSDTGELAVGGGYEYITVDVTLELPEETEN